MRKFIHVSLLLVCSLTLLCLPVPAQITSKGTIWSIIQDVIVPYNGASPCSPPATTCAVPISATTSGDAGVFLLTTSGTAISSISPGSWTHCTAQGGNLGTCNVVNATAEAEKDASYITSLPGGVTGYTVTLSGSEVNFITAEFTELRKVGGSIAADASGSLNDTTNCQNSSWACLGPTLTLTGTNDAIICGYDAQHTPDNPVLYAPYRFLNGAPSNGGTNSGYLLGATTATVLQYTQISPGQAVAWCIAFK